MPTPTNPTLYAKAKEIANETYKKPSAYKSGFIVRKYKELGGAYKDDSQPKNLQRWFSEKWIDVGNKEYPVYRPTKRVSKKTPLTVREIAPSNLREQIILKQKIRGNKNLPAFISK
jgi:hypothetical protein